MPTDAKSSSAFLSDTAQQVLEVGARLESGPSSLLIQAAFKKELEDQFELFDALSLADLAHTPVMMDVGVVPGEAGRELLAALLQLGNCPDDFKPDPATGDLYTNREAWLAEHSRGSGWLGIGRARREATTTAFLIKLREGLLGLAHALTVAGQALTARALEFRTALMPDYTYLQPAQPTTFGHYLLGFAYPIRRDLERIRALYGRIDRSPAGCGSTNGSRLPQDRRRIGELLGFDGLVGHARDAMWQADLPIEAAAALTAILINFDRLAEDLQIYSTEEFGLVELDDAHARASKIMPQKKNPFALTHIRGLAGTMIGTLTASAALSRTPSGQPDNRLALYGMMPRAIEGTRDAVGLVGEVVGLLNFNAQRGRERLQTGFSAATDLAEVLVAETDLDFRQAHRLVGCLVRSRLQDGNLTDLAVQEVSDMAQQVLERKIDLSEEALRSALDPEVGVAVRTEPGGAAPAAVESMAAECEQALAEAGRWKRERRERLQTAEAALLRMARDRARSTNGVGQWHSLTQHQQKSSGSM